MEPFKNDAEQQLIQKAERLQKRGQTPVSFNVIVISVYGWHIAIPVLLGIALGRFLDAHVPLPPLSWTLNFILLGFALGFFNATRWLRREGTAATQKDLLKQKDKK